MIKLFKKIFAKSPAKVARENLQKLGQKFLLGQSTDSDLPEWETNIDIMIHGVNLAPKTVMLRIFFDMASALFEKYLLKHYPNHERLTAKYSNEDIDIMRADLYREMMILSLGEVIGVVHKWEFKTHKEYLNFISKINEYVSFKNRSISKLHLTEKCASASTEELLLLLCEIKLSVLDYTKEQKDWHLRINNLSTFKLC